MKTLSLLLVFVLVGVCIGAEPASTQQGKEPTYRGKTLGEWIALTKDKDEYFRMAAAESIGKIGPEAETAVPALTEMLKDKNGQVRLTAALALMEIIPEAKTVIIPVLTELLKERTSRFGGLLHVPWEALVQRRRLPFQFSRNCSRIRTRMFGMLLLRPWEELALRPFLLLPNC